MTDIPSPPPFDPASLVGTTLDGRYLVEEHLTTGGMGAVFRGRHVYMRKDVALKVLRPDLSASADLVERFRREAQIAASLEHPHIVRVTDFGRTPEGWLFLTMELLFGESLFERLRREGSLPPEEAVTILWQVCDGLEAAHARGVVHRDLKPENVFLARSPSGREVTKILDFGIAKMAEPSEVGSTQAGMVVGTPEYLSPEQATGSEVDGRADLYTVGLMAWRALTGRHPFKADDPRSLLMMQATRPVPPLTEARPDLAEVPALVALVARACEKDPAARFQTAAEMKAALETALGPAFTLPGATPLPRLSWTDLPTVSRSELAAASGTVRLTSPALSPGPLPADPFLPPRTSQSVEVSVDTTSVPAPPGAPPASPAQDGWLTRHRTAAASGLALALALAGLATWRLLEPPPAPPPPVLAPVAAVAAAPPIAPPVEAAPAPTPQPPPAPPAPDDLTLARGHLTAGRARQARALLEALAVKTPGDAELLRLLGRAFHDEGEELKAIDTWRAAQALAPLDEVSLRQLATDLGREKGLADRAARVLVQAGGRAAPVLAGATGSGSLVVRLRALAVAREIGPASRVDVLGGYLALLADADCDLRRAAARGLGDLKDKRALPRLKERAAERIEKRGLFGVLIESKPVCGGLEAAEASKKLEGGADPHP